MKNRLFNLMLVAVALAIGIFNFFPNEEKEVSVMNLSQLQILSQANAETGGESCTSTTNCKTGYTEKADFWTGAYTCCEKYAVNETGHKAK